MKRRFPFSALPIALAFVMAHSAVARPGTVTWSDGRTITGDLTLTPGKQLKLFTSGAPVEFPLAEVKEIRFTPEKEQIAQGFYFPNAGQATQAKTDDIYPVRYLHAQFTMPDGRVLEGHLFTTVLYVQNDAGAQKVVLEAKQTGADGQKLADLPYPTHIQFTDTAAGMCRLDLSHAVFPGAKPAVVVSRPDLAPVTLEPGGSPLVWTLPTPDAKKLVFSIEADDGIHVAWPATEADPVVVTSVQNGLHTLQDFYDTRTLLGTFAEGSDVYSLVMMYRKASSVGMAASITPWSLVILRWNVDANTHKATLLNRASFAIGRANDGMAPPSVLKDPALLNDLTAATGAAP
jgi:hypothetical protein